MLDGRSARAAGRRKGGSMTWSNGTWALLRMMRALFGEVEW